jgi:hypothetical protein
MGFRGRLCHSRHESRILKIPIVFPGLAGGFSRDRYFLVAWFQRFYDANILALFMPWVY